MATGTAVDVVMPQMGVSVSEGTITKWLKAEGEAVAADEALLEISTDKVDTEVPSPAEGVLGKHPRPGGRDRRRRNGARHDRARGCRRRAGAPGASRPRRTAPRARGASRSARAPAADQTEPPQTEPAHAEPQAPAEPGPPAEDDDGHGDGRTFVSPVVARIAAEHNVDVSAISGTGRGGRVTKKDILSYLETSGARVEEAPPPEPAAAPAPPPPAEPPPPAGPPPAGLRRLHPLHPSRPSRPRRPQRRRSPKRPKLPPPASSSSR